MALLVKQNEPLDPVPIRVFGAETEVSQPRHIPKLLAKFLLSHMMDYTACCGNIEQFDRYLGC